MAVVLPAPSGPTSPTISPARTCKLSPSTARKVPKVLTRFSVSSRTSFAMLLEEGHISRHAEFQLAFGVADFQLDRVHGGAAAFDGLNVARRELGLVGDKGDRGVKRLVGERVHADG